jgi:phosphoglycolate phosphatase-like HAD superfamily hydrolase
LSLKRGTVIWQRDGRNIAVTWGCNSEKKLKKVNPDIIVNSPKKIIEKISGK